MTELQPQGSSFNEITEEIFVNAVRQELNLDVTEGANQGQYSAIFSPIVFE